MKRFVRYLAFSLVAAVCVTAVTVVRADDEGPGTEATDMCGMISSPTSR
jgi:hypothetical protein